MCNNVLAMNSPRLGVRSRELGDKWCKMRFGVVSRWETKVRQLNVIRRQRFVLLFVRDEGEEAERLCGPMSVS